jgi:hypothetical protein
VVGGVAPSRAENRLSRPYGADVAAHPSRLATHGGHCKDVHRAGVDYPQDLRVLEQDRLVVARLQQAPFFEAQPQQKQLVRVVVGVLTLRLFKDLHQANSR